MTQYKCTHCHSINALKENQLQFCLTCGGGVEIVSDELPFTNMDYIYHSDKLAKIESEYAGKECKAVRRKNGKCIRGRNSNMLVEFENGDQVTIPARMLRKIRLL